MFLSEVGAVASCGARFGARLLQASTFDEARWASCGAMSGARSPEVATLCRSGRRVRLMAPGGTHIFWGGSILSFGIRT